MAPPPPSQPLPTSSSTTHPLATRTTRTATNPTTSSSSKTPSPPNDSSTPPAPAPPPTSTPSPSIGRRMWERTKIIATELNELTISDRERRLRKAQADILEIAELYRKYDEGERAMGMDRAVGKLEREREEEREREVEVEQMKESASRRG